MAKITITPMIGSPKATRLDSLTGCHALFERAEYTPFDAGRLGVTLESAIKKILLTDHARHDLAMTGKVSLIITLES